MLVTGIIDRDQKHHIIGCDFKHQIGVILLVCQADIELAGLQNIKEMRAFLAYGLCPAIAAIGQKMMLLSLDCPSFMPFVEQRRRPVNIIKPLVMIAQLLVNFQNGHAFNPSCHEGRLGTGWAGKSSRMEFSCSCFVFV